MLVATTMSKLVAIAAVVLVAACSNTGGAGNLMRTCPEMQGVPEGNLLLFGEMHGSVEAPALIYRLACSLARSQDVVVGLEIPSQEQPAIDAYLAGHGASGDQARLTSSGFWQRNTDGRSSVAMLDLLGRLRALRSEGVAVSVIAFDDQPNTKLDRDVAIANGIRRIRTAHPEAKIIALMGNLHAMGEPMQLGGRQFVPSGSLLQDLHPVSVFIAYPAGTTWACMPACGIQKLEAVKGVAGAPRFSAGAPMGGYSHTYLLPSITASPPAVHKAENH